MLTEGRRRINGISRLHGSADRETKKTHTERGNRIRARSFLIL
jgi:hypothetical protein